MWEKNIKLHLVAIIPAFRLFPPVVYPVCNVFIRNNQVKGSGLLKSSVPFIDRLDGTGWSGIPLQSFPLHHQIMLRPYGGLCFLLPLYGLVLGYCYNNPLKNGSSCSAILPWSSTLG